MLSKLLLLFVVTFSHNLSFADDSCHEENKKSEHMRVVRIDYTAPCECKPFKIQQFRSPDIDYFIYGINSTKGANHQINLSREEARTLWKALTPKNAASTQQKYINILKKTKRLKGFYDTLVEVGPEMGFEYVVEGEILEALSIVDLTDSYDDDDYFITGGIAYFRGSATTGELDLVVFDRKTCNVVSIGEAKLTKSASKAKKQLNRFKQFMKSI